MSAIPLTGLLRRNLNSIIPITAFIVLILGLRTINPYFLATRDSVVTLVLDMSWFLIAATGLTLVILMGSFDFSVPNIVKLSAIICGVFYEYLGFGVIPLALLISLIFGLINGLLLARFNIPSFMATLATGIIAEGIAQLISGGYIRVIVDPNFIALATATIPPGIGLPAIFYWAIALWAIGIFITLGTPFGRKIYAIGSNIEGARLAGVKLVKTRMLVFMLCALYAGIAGILYASQLQGSHMHIGTLDTLPLFASIVVGGTALSGGIGGVHRTLLGVLIIKWLDSGMSMVALDLNFRMVTFGAIALIMTILTIDRRRVKIIR